MSFNETRTKVLLRTVPGYREQLVRLAARYSSGGQRGEASAEVDLEEFLASLQLVNTWPDLPGVWFAPDLRALAETSVRDAQAVDERLSAGERGGTVFEAVDPGDVPGRLGTDWVAPLTSFQVRDIAKLLSLTHGANFSVPGAGKTRTALAVYAALRAEGSVRQLLVVGPKSAYEAWQEESTTCFSSAPHMQVFAKHADYSAEIILINYERLNRVQAELAEWVSDKPTMIVLDEAHRMKLGVQGAYGAACMALGPLASHRLILTGTPAPNGAKDLESLLSFVWPGHGRRVVDRAVGGKDLAYASQVLRPLFTRTTKNELGLPPVKIRRQSILLPAAHRRLYSALVNKVIPEGDTEQERFAKLGRVMVYLMMASTSPALLEEGSSKHEPLPFYVPPLEIPQDDSLSALMRDLPRYELSPKYKEVIRVVTENAEAGRKTLVWSTFVRNLTSLERALQKFKPAVVHGGTIDRERQIKRFRSEQDCMVLLSNPATLGEGISLHHVCHDAIYVDRDFAAGRFLQSLDRIHRLGLASDTETRITVLTAEGTIDDVVHERLGRKLTFLGAILDDPALQQLADPEEDMDGWGMDVSDRQAVLAHVDAAS
ncbi:DEAD/DEAH box helicase [Streptomyces melanogenes]|uniref:DEAD/DEAH box helicase n=1 Tax=Streptomyces melanogenes TaxID=67326 RepID=UPI00378CA8FB